MHRALPPRFRVANSMYPNPSPFQAKAQLKEMGNMQSGSLYNNECVILLTITHSIGIILRVRFDDIRKRLDQSYKADSRELSEVLDKQNALRPNYRKYLDLEARRLDLERRIQRTIVARGTDVFEDIKSGRNGGDSSKKTVGVVVDHDLPLWQVMVAVLEQYGELQAIELQRALEYLDHGTSRSAIESALKTHRDVFQVRESGRYRFVSLRGA